MEIEDVVCRWQAGPRHGPGPRDGQEVRRGSYEPGAQCQRAAAQRSVDTMTRILGRSTMPVKIWVADAKRVRREQLSFQILGQTLSMSMDLFDFGVQHTITSPPADQVTDLTKLVTKAEQQAGLGQTSQGGGTASP